MQHQQTLINLVHFQRNVFFFIQASWAGIFLSSQAAAQVRVLRALRAFRPLRAVSRWEGMRVMRPLQEFILKKIFTVFLWDQHHWDLTSCSAGWKFHWNYRQEAISFVDSTILNTDVTFKSQTKLPQEKIFKKHKLQSSIIANLPVKHFFCYFWAGQRQLQKWLNSSCVVFNCRWLSMPYCTVSPRLDMSSSYVWWCGLSLGLWVCSSLKGNFIGEYPLWLIWMWPSRKPIQRQRSYQNSLLF